MGLKPGWRKILEENFGYCFLNSMPRNVSISYVIDDYFINFFRMFNGVESWDEVKQRVLKRTKTFDALSKDILIYVVLFDEKAFVPSAKTPTQLQRMVSSNTVPLNAEEIETFVPGVSDLSAKANKSAKPGEYLNRAWLTSAVRPRIISFITNAFCSLDYVDAVRERRIVIDGAKIDLLINNELLRSRRVDHIKGDIAMNRHLEPRVQYECELVIPTKAQNLIGLERQDGTGFKHCTFYQSDTIGESDLKIEYHISRLLPHGNVFISSCDSDMIAILLLNMKDWIDPRTGMIPHSIYLDNTPPGCDTAKSSYIDVVLLWSSILVYFEQNHPKVLHPIETFVVLMILSGSDFVLPFKQISPQRIWDAFCHGGEDILFQASLKPSFSFDTVNKKIRKSTETVYHEPALMDDFKIQEFGSFVSTNALVVCDQIIGVPSAYHAIKLVENKLFEFVLHVYQQILLVEKGRFKGTVEEKYEFLKTAAEARDQKTNSVSHKFEMRSADEMKAEIRRVWWNLDYWINGGKPNRKFEHSTEPYFKNCLEKNDEGLSVWGWDLDPISNVVIRAKRVVCL